MNRLLRDPLVLAAVLWTLAGAGVLYALDAANDQVRAFWAFQPPLDALLAWSAWRVHRMATGAIRRFWLVMTVAGVLFTVGDTVQALTALAGHGQKDTAGGPVQGLLFAVGLGAIIVAMLLHPIPGSSRREKVAFWLDSSTVLVGGAVVAYCFAIEPSQQDGGNIAGTLAAGCVILTSCFAAVKLVLSGNAPMHRAAAIPMIVSAGINSIGFFLEPNPDGTLEPYIFVVRLLPSLLIGLGARIQEDVARFDQGSAFGSRRRRPYSLLPYGSIAVAFTTVVLETPAGPQPRLWGAMAGLGVIVVLVVCRQLAAFHENNRLIDQLREHEARLRHQALYDGLTGLANRTHFHEEVTLALRDGEARSTSLLLIDLDGFKAVNDTLGHAAGDVLLAGVGGKLTACVRPGDVVARLGGDEFAVLLRDCDAEGAEHTSERILRELADPIPFEETAVRANASIGIACATRDDDVDSLVRDADLAMYAAKRQGKGTWTRHHRDLAPAAG
ncbi:GGDEF domain-containing protein [Paractinoplanes atraurantiacus]|uniref:GGDEF domain-containing protein n=1 Tax=Paractinoplanes atraurantiacus TaxID=1036182 RepID=UPI000BE4181A|nr:GGDEF domain-containing protein [Actinoplanes atraurantiacus]